MNKEPVRHDAREQAQQQTDEQRVERDRQQREDPLYLEKTRPEDPSARPGQLTRDNVNPNIPSGERGAPTNAGGIVDPTSLGMPQGGVAPTSPMQLETSDPKMAPGGADLPRSGSINEPPGSDVLGKSVPDHVSPQAKGAAQQDEEEAEEADLSDPDEMEEELDEAVDEGDAKKVNHRTPPSKRKK